MRSFLFSIFSLRILFFLLHPFLAQMPSCTFRQLSSLFDLHLPFGSVAERIVRKISYSSAISASTEIIYKLRLQTWQNNACGKKTLINDLKFLMPQHTSSEVTFSLAFKSCCIMSNSHFWRCMLRHTKR